MARQECNNFEDAAAEMDSWCEAWSGPMEPVNVYGMEGTKPSIGKTGVHLCYLKHHEHKALTCEQQRELSGWQANNSDAHEKGLH